MRDLVLRQMVGVAIKLELAAADLTPGAVVAAAVALKQSV
jgi:hypothetical protein